ncbi:MAG: hypothetical protein PHH26_07850 [Candidatus Thermoplasmatota archaeon]|nr:hypothetical protein [Candidatus Thermoplasmatota archaeon]
MNSRRILALLAVILLACASVPVFASAGEQAENAEKAGSDSAPPSAENEDKKENATEERNIGFLEQEGAFNGKFVSFAHSGTSVLNYSLAAESNKSITLLDAIVFPQALDCDSENCTISLTSKSLNVSIFDSRNANMVITNSGPEIKVQFKFPSNFTISSENGVFKIERPHDGYDLDARIMGIGRASLEYNEKENTMVASIGQDAQVALRATLCAGQINPTIIESLDFVEKSIAAGDIGAEINVAKGAGIGDYSVKYRDMVLGEKTKIEGKTVLTIDSPNEKGCVVVVNLDKSVVTGGHLETIRVRVNGAEAVKSAKISAVSSAAQQIGTVLGVDKYLYYLEKSEDGVRLIMSVPHFSLLDLEIVDLDVVFPGWEQQSGNFDNFLSSMMGSLSSYAREDIDLDAMIDVSGIDFDVWQIVTSGGDISIDIGIHLDCNISVLKLDAGLKDAIQSSAGEIPLDAGTLQEMLLKPYITADQIRIMLVDPVKKELENWMRQRVEDTVRDGFKGAEIKRVSFVFQNLDPKALDGDLSKKPVSAKIDIDLLIKHQIGISAIFKKSSSPKDPEVQQLKSEKGILGMMSYPTKFNMNASAGWRYNLRLSVPEQYQFVYANRQSSYGSVDSSSIGWEMDAKNSATPLSAKYIVGVSSESFIWAIFIAGSVVLMVVATLIGTAFFIVRARRKRN